MVHTYIQWGKKVHKVKEKIFQQTSHRTGMDANV